MSDERNHEKRREFLKGMLLGSGAAAVAIATGGAVAGPARDERAAPAPKARPRGYQETPHVREYYKTAQF